MGMLQQSYRLTLETLPGLFPSLSDFSLLCPEFFAAKSPVQTKKLIPNIIDPTVHGFSDCSKLIVLVNMNESKQKRLRDLGEGRIWN